MIRCTFYNPRDISEDGWIEYNGIRISYRPGLEWGPTLMSRYLVAVGKTDDSMIVQEVGRKQEHAMRHEFGSFHMVAKSPMNPAPISPLMFTTLDEFQKNAFVAPNDRAGAIARGFLSIVNGDMSLTAIGKTAIEEYEVVSVVVTPGQREAFNIISYTPNKWHDLHGKTQNTMIRNGWVVMEGTMPVITDLGRSVMEEKPKEISKIDPDVNNTLIALTASQREVFSYIIAGKVKKWDETHGKTKNVMIRNGWVIVEKNRPVLTETGNKIVTEFGLDEKAVA